MTATLNLYGGFKSGYAGIWRVNGRISNDLYSLEDPSLSFSTSAFEFGGVVANHGSYLLLGGNSVSIGGFNIGFQCAIKNRWEREQ